MEDMSGEEKKSLVIAIGIVVLTIVAFLAFVYGGGVLFYIIALIAIILGFYMAYRVSKEGKQKGQKAQWRARKAR